VKIVLAVGRADPLERLTPVMGVFELICRLSGSFALVLTGRAVTS
jgi:hypothetical protein